MSVDLSRAGIDIDGSSTRSGATETSDRGLSCVCLIVINNRKALLVEKRFEGLGGLRLIVSYRY
jgi:hypothetical protein